MSVTSLLYQTLTICALYAIRVAGDKTCNGTTGYKRENNATLLQHYEKMRAMYTNCTHVYTNLEIIDLSVYADENSSDLSFLKDIRYVRGYVRLSFIDITNITIPLDNLQVIRGHSSCYYNRTGKNYTLLVTNNDGAVRLNMPNLEEITQGDAVFYDNMELRYVNHVRWAAILKSSTGSVEFLQWAYYDPESIGLYSLMPLNCHMGYGWNDDPLLCQKGIVDSEGLELRCHSSCNKRCFGAATSECCHPTCAIGCTGALANQCTVCRDYKNITGGNCVESCPAGTHNEFPLCRGFYQPSNAG